MSDWMKTLAEHYESFRQEREGDLIILFDIDGTILDLRYSILYTLKSFDRVHETNYFRNLSAEDIRIDEDDMELLLRSFDIPDNDKYRVLSWYMTRRWSSYSSMQSSYPVRGVFEVIRWFQLQPRTFVGLNTSRPESLRPETLRLVNQIGKEFKVGFPSELLYMSHTEWATHVPSSKIAGIRYFQGCGYNVFAMVDNEISNLESIADEFPDEGILLLHANAVRESVRSAPNKRAVAGNQYQVAQLVPQGDLPKHVQFIWRGLASQEGLERFLKSNIGWAEIGVQLDLESHRPTPLDLRSQVTRTDGKTASLELLLREISRASRSVRLDLDDAAVLDKTIELVTKLGIAGDRVAFHGSLERLQERGFRRLRAAFPNAIIECPIDFLSPLIRSCPDKAREIALHLKSWGINRFALSWRLEEKHVVLERLEEWGIDVSIHSVFDLESFLQAVLLLPRAIVCDFDTPRFQLLVPSGEVDEPSNEDEPAQRVRYLVQ